MKKHLIQLGILALILTAVPTAIEAEVSVRTDFEGQYVSTVIAPGGPPWNRGVWGQRMRYGMERGRMVLNSRGDRLGDSLPTIAESNVAPHHPWAIWSRHNGQDLDLVWSCWERSWSSISPLVLGTPPGDDLDPDLAFTGVGLPIVAWWNEDSDGRGTIYFSMYLDTWMTPLKISTDDIGGRYPTITSRLRRVEIRYESDDGSMEIVQPVVLWLDPNTITDDIDPQTHFRFMAARVTLRNPH